MHKFTGLRCVVVGSLLAKRPNDWIIQQWNLWDCPRISMSHCDICYINIFLNFEMRKKGLVNSDARRYFVMSFFVPSRKRFFRWIDHTMFWAIAKWIDLLTIPGIWSGSNICQIPLYCELIWVFSVVTGDTSNHRPSNGTEDEPSPFEPTEHAQGGSTYEQAVTSEHLGVSIKHIFCMIYHDSIAIIFLT